MSIRINHAKNFRGKAYVAADKLDELIQSLTLTGPSKTTEGTEWKLDFTYADQTGDNPQQKVAVDLTGIKNYIDNKAITVDVGAGITIDTSVALKPVISADVDGKTIVLSGAGNDGKLASGLKIKKLDTATPGYAASYQLVDATGAAIGGESATIDIVKDQFIGSAKFGWSTANDSTGAGWTEAKPESGTVYPCIKIEVWTNTDGNAESSETTLTPLYIPLADVFQEYVGSNGVATEGNVISGVVDTATSEKVYTAKGSTAPVLSVGADGFKVAGIQDAIDLAVNDEHAKMGKYVADVADNTQAAITAVEEEIKTYTANVVQVVEKDVTPTRVGETTEYSCQVTARNIIGVFDPNGVQIYPEIKKENGTFTLTADYGTETADAKWTVVCTEALPALEKTTIAPSTLADLNYKNA